MIGIDLVSVEDFRHRMNKGGEPFLREAFVESELSDRDVVRLAGLIAAKQAVSRAAPTPASALSDVELRWEEGGRVRGRLGGLDFEISMSRDGDYAVATAMLVGREH